MPTQLEGRRGGAVGAKIDYRDGHWIVPDHPIIPFIVGDGTGPDIWRAAAKVFDAAVARTSGGKRSVVWREILAGEKSFNQSGDWLPDRYQADVEIRIAAPDREGDPVRDQAAASFRDPRSQRQHHEVHGRRVSGLGVRSRQGAIRGADRH